MSESTPADSPPPADDPRTAWLMRYEAWLKLLARLEIDSRFQGKFSESDAVQQTLLEAWRCWDRFRGDDETARRAWLRQILAHQLARLARHFGGTQKRDAAREVSLDNTLAQSAARLEGLVAMDQATPSGEVERQEEQLRLAAALERLPSDYRDVIVLRHLEDLSHDEIAARLGRSAGAVRMLWLRALTALKQEIADNR
jgi:RNA polymerase sigma-70 factor (ECF subfamily)